MFVYVCFQVDQRGVLEDVRLAKASNNLKENQKTNRQSRGCTGGGGVASEVVEREGRRHVKLLSGRGGDE